jgi:probable rRNA maturation factor
MTVRIDIQYAVEGIDTLPGVDAFKRWAEAAVEVSGPAELVIRVVDGEESAILNESYRGKSGPTNVLSFPYEPPTQIDTNYLGDVVICAPLVAREAVEQGKHEIPHWAHLVVHGILHLQGYDHQTPQQAVAMESIERNIMRRLGYSDPYQESHY